MQKKSTPFLFGLIVVIILIKAITLLPFGSKTENLLENGGFEKENVEEIWNLTKNKGETQSLTTEKENVYKGKHAIEIMPKGQIKTTLTDLEKQTNYSFSAFTKVNDDESSALLEVLVGEELQKRRVTQTSYEKEVIIFNTGDETEVTFFYLGDKLNKEQTAYIDEVEVIKSERDVEIDVTLNVEHLQLAVGDTYDLSYSVFPSTALNQDILFKNEPADIASIDSEGKITALKPGTSQIMAQPQASGTSTVVNITVTETKQPWYSNQDDAKWELTKEDNFDGTELDTDLWTIRGKEYADYHRDDLVEVSDGTLKLGIEREDNGDLVLGRVDTHSKGFDEALFEQKYGFFEVKVDIPPTEKTYFAFWTMHYPNMFKETGDGKKGAEIDITETVYQGDFTEAVVHYDGYEGSHKSVASGKKPAPNVHEGFHVFGLEWDEDFLRFYFDGELTWEVMDENVIPWVKEIFILSSGWARGTGWGDGSTENADLPYYSEIDWFRAYERTDLANRTDNEDPILYGLETLETEVDSTIDLLKDVYAIDNVDHMDDITKRIEYDDSALDLSANGEYEVTYSVTDKAGNTATKERTVIVTN